MVVLSVTSLQAAPAYGKEVWRVVLRAGAILDAVPPRVAPAMDARTRAVVAGHKQAVAAWTSAVVARTSAVAEHT